MSAWHSTLDEAIKDQRARGYEPGEIDWTQVRDPVLGPVYEVRYARDAAELWAKRGGLSITLPGPAPAPGGVTQVTNEQMDAIRHGATVKWSVPHDPASFNPMPPAVASRATWDAWEKEELRRQVEPSKAQVCGMRTDQGVRCPTCQERLVLIGGGERGEVQVFHCNGCGWDEEDDGWPGPAA